jgi:hypothetical protein
VGVPRAGSASPSGRFLGRWFPNLRCARQSIPPGRNRQHQRRALEAEHLARVGELLMSNRSTLRSALANSAPTPCDAGALGQGVSERLLGVADGTRVEAVGLKVADEQAGSDPDRVALAEREGCQPRGRGSETQRE